jgi:t-SNARE complex subunit (syntaxin)
MKELVQLFGTVLCSFIRSLDRTGFLSARKADLKKGFQHLVLLVLLVVLVVVLVVVVGTRVKKRF